MSHVRHVADLIAKKAPLANKVTATTTIEIKKPSQHDDRNNRNDRAIGSPIFLSPWRANHWHHDECLTHNEKQVKGKVRSRQETVNRLIMSWGILKQHFPHSLDKYQTTFNGLAALAQLAPEKEELCLFDVDCSI